MIIINTIDGYPFLCSTFTAHLTTPHLFRVDRPKFSVFCQEIHWNGTSIFVESLSGKPPTVIILKTSLQSEMFEASTKRNISEASHFSRSISLKSPFTIFLYIWISSLQTNCAYPYIDKHSYVFRQLYLYLESIIVLKDSISMQLRQL